MKKKIILLPLLAAFLYVVLTGYSSGPGFSSIYGPASGCGGSGCHAPSATSTTTVSIQLLNSSMSPATYYAAGGSYFVRITGTQTDGSLSLPNFGFQVAVVNGSGSTAGNVTSVAGTHTVTVAGVKVVEHSSPIAATTGSGGSGTTYVMTIPWTAATSGTGTVSLKGVINAVNGGGADAGDKWNIAGAATVSELPAIGGSTFSVCQGSNITLTNSVPVGAWTSGTTSVATVNALGVVSGISPGTSVISYTFGGSFVTQTVTVNANPGAITGNTPLCVSQTMTLSNSVSGGTWSTPTTTVATVVSGTGFVTGVGPGTAIITYAIGTCSTTTTVTVNANPTISGTASVCLGNTTSLTPSVTGGTWVSSVPANGTVNASGSPGIVGGIAVGTTNILYTLPTGCNVTTPVTVNAMPAAIGGTLIVCSAATVTATNSVSGGTWSTTAGTGSISVGATSGVITGAGVGTANLTYTMPGACRTTAIVTVNPLPNIITGTTTFCANATTTLNSTTTGGTWTSGNPSVATVGASTGIVTPATVAGGSAPISYALSTGCQRVATVNINPISPVTGTLTVCPSSSTTLSSAPAGGTWTSGTTSVATVNPTTGAVTGITGGTASITYTLSTGCNSSAIVTVNATAPITGGGSVCMGDNLALANSIPSGTWASSASAVGTISTSGVVAALTAGTTTISYTTPTGCVTTTVVTVNALPAGVTASGGGTFCGGATITASGGAGGTIYFQGTTSGGTSTATPSTSQSVSSSGTYYFRSQSAPGCWGTEGSVNVTINPNPPAITGTAAVCVGATTTLANSMGGGTWSSSTPSVGTINSITGVVGGISAGTTTISYIITATACFTTQVVTVTTAPAATTVSGAGTFCGSTTINASGGAGGTIYYQGTTSGGTSTATPSTSQSVSSSGTYYFRSQSAGGCWGPEGSVAVVINPNPATITGNPTLCDQSTTTLATVSSGGTWSSSTLGVASINPSGVVTGTLPGTSTISYTYTATGCYTTQVVTVYPLPGAISGTMNVCQTSTTTLSSSTTGGTWTSSNAAVGTIGLTSGIFNGLTSGTSIVTYTLGTGCFRTAVVTVNPLPAAISGGGTTLCVASTLTLTSGTPGGIWGSGSSSVSVDATTGVVTGVSAGTAVVSYTLGTGCFVTTTITVNSIPAAIGGTPSVCVGFNTTLTNATSGGTWSSSTTANAIVGSTSGTVTGVAAGTSVISYILPATGCYRTATVVVNPLPSTLSGTATTCVGVTTTLTSTPAGGTWTTSNAGIATVGSGTGIVTGTAIGTANITYTLPTGCARSTTVTVSPAPSAGTISGSTSVCTGLTVTLSSSVSGGTWSSSNPAAGTINSSGVVTGITAGTTTITYTVSGACGTVTSTTNVTVTTSASAGTLSGPSEICVSSSGSLSATVLGGTWISSTPSVATVGFTSGVVSGVAAGTTTITYTVSGGCGVASVTTVVSVNALPSPISGTASVCVDATTTLTSPGGGTWGSANTSIADVGSATGIVTGIAAGTTTITYTSGTGCITTRTVTVIALPAAIGGVLTPCAGTTSTLTNSSGAGTWSSSNISVASIGVTSGIVSALSGGNSVINFTLASTGCVSTAILSVNPVPAAITGTTNVCIGGTTTLSSATTGGTWTSSNLTVATVGSSSGIVTGGAAGTSAITYTLPTGCRRITPVTVNALPATIGGTLSVCVGSGTTLTNTTSGGTWASSNTGVATIGSATGVVTGIATGTAIITYTASSGCSRTAVLTVNPVPGAIGGALSVCSGSTTTLTNTTAGGIWISGSTGIASVISATGVVTGVSAGTATITYSLATGCFSTAVVTVDPVPTAISGTPSVCVGGTRTLTSTPSGGTWSSSATTIGSVDASTGVVTGIATGSTTITYQLATGCYRTVPVFVNPLPGAISGTGSACVGGSTTLSSTPAGGTWSSSSIATATVGTGSGIVSGVAAGTATITYALSTGCSSTTIVTINALPSAIAGTSTVCVAATTTLSCTPGGGTWSSSSTGIASIVSGTGVVTGVAAGTSTVTYTLPTGCTRTVVVSVNPLPSAGTVSGSSTVCVAATTTLTAGVSGGIWSTTTGKVTVSASGVVTGVAAGVDTVRYTVSTVCGSATATHAMTVNPLPVAATISGGTNVCVGLTGTLTPSAGGGTWASANTAIANVSSTGVVTGVASGTATISYTVSNSCGNATTTVAVTVYAIAVPGTISGSDTVCQADTIHLTSTVTGGTWSSSNTAIATVTSTGIVVGVTPGTATISYTVSNLCSTRTATFAVIVKSAAACATSVDPVMTRNATIRLFPNPTHGSLTIETPVAGTLAIYSLDGKDIGSYPVKDTTSSFSLPGGTAAGVYMCRFTGNDGSFGIIRLIYEP